MTIIDTAIYANGALRLSRHGAGRGGNVLVHVPTGQQFPIQDTVLPMVVAGIKRSEEIGESSRSIFALAYYDATGDDAPWR
jgi:hypothetical protein